jgi:hypothetical protein
VKIGKLVAMAMVVGLPALGCGDDNGTGDGGGSGSGTEGDTTGTGSNTTMVADGSTTVVVSSSQEGTGSSSAGEESTSTGEPPPIEVTVEGEVVDFTNMAAPIADAEISVFDLPGVTAMSDDMGLFSISPLPPDTPATFVVAPTPAYWGAVIPVAIGSDMLQEDVQLAQIPSAFVDLQIMYLEPQMQMAMSPPPDLGQAIVIVRLLNNTAVSEGPTTIDMTPAPPAGTFYAPDAMGAPVLDQNTIEFAALPVVVFFNIPDSAPGDITIAATHPVRECTVLFPETPTLGQHITLIDIECLPP